MSQNEVVRSIMVWLYGLWFDSWYFSRNWTMKHIFHKRYIEYRTVDGVTRSHRIECPVFYSQYYFDFLVSVKDFVIKQATEKYTELFPDRPFNEISYEPFYHRHEDVITMYVGFDSTSIQYRYALNRKFKRRRDFSFDDIVCNTDLIVTDTRISRTTPEDLERLMAGVPKPKKRSIFSIF